MDKLTKVSDEQWASCNQINRKIYDDYFINNVELSSKTILVYKSALKIWFNWIRENLNNKIHTDITGIEYKRFQNWLINRGSSSSDVAFKRSAISSLNNYILVYYESEYPVFRNFITKAIKKPEKSFVHDRIPPTKEEVENIIKTLEESNKPNKKMLIAYLKFTYKTGCRRAESIQVMKNYIDLPLIVKKVKTKDENNNDIEVDAKFYLTPKIRCKGRGKTGKVRQLKFDEDVMLAFKDYLDNERGEDDCPYMFVTKRFDKIVPVTEAAVNYWSSNIFTPILGRRFHPHILREAIATDLVVQQGKSIESVKSLLGHESSETTKIYVCGVDESEESNELFI